jgi:hypothetical protein
MPWFFVDDAFADSKPVMALDRALRNEAIGLWVRCGAWSAKEETDGRVGIDIVRQFGGTPRLVKALQFQAELWQKPGENTPETMVETTGKSSGNRREIIFANWEKWQKTKAENDARRKADAARQSTHRRKKGRGYIPPDPDGDAEMSQRDADLPDPEVSRCESQRPDPDPTRPDPSLVETSHRGVTSGDAREAPPKCNRHKENSPTPCPACKARREWEEAEAARLAADELTTRRRRREAIDLCKLCDQNGQRDFGSFVGKCTHPDNPPDHQEASNA